MSNLVSSGTAALPLSDAVARRRALLQAGGLLLIGAFDPVVNGVLRFGALYGVPWPHDTVHYAIVVRICLGIVLFFWLSWVVIARTTLAMVSPGQRLLQRGAAVGLGAAYLYATGPIEGFRNVQLIVLGCTTAWLAVEVCRSHGIVLEKATTEKDVRYRRAEWWYLTTRAFGACVAGGATAYLSAQALRVLDFELAPVMEQDQNTVVGIEGPTDLLGTVVVSAAIEDIVIVAAVASLMTAARRPVWQIYTTICVVEVLAHGYFGLPALGMLIYAALRVRLFLENGRVLPLIAAHVAMDTAGGIIMPLPLPYRLAIMLPLAVMAALLLGRVNQAADEAHAEEATA